MKMKKTSMYLIAVVVVLLIVYIAFALIKPKQYSGPMYGPSEVIIGDGDEIGCCELISTESGTPVHSYCYNDITEQECDDYLEEINDQDKNYEKIFYRGAGKYYCLGNNDDPLYGAECIIRGEKRTPVATPTT